MSTVYNHRQINASSRLNELLDAIRVEFENVSQDTSMLKIQRDDFEHKIASQIQEMNQIQQNVYELERAHQRMKQQYEEEILRLRRELEARGGQLPPTAVGTVGNVEKRSYGPLPGAPLSGPVPPGPSHIPPPQFNHSRPPQPVSVPNPDHQLGAQPKLSIRTTSGQAPQGQAAQPTQKTIQLFGNVDPETITPTFKHEGPDWIAWFNPKIPRTLDVNLSQDLEHPSVVCCVKYSADGKYLATGCNKVTHVYDATDGSKIATLIDDSAPEDGDLYIRSICFSPDGRFLATGAEDKQIRIWSMAKQNIVTYLTGHDQDIYSLDYSRDGRFLASGSGDRTTKLWEVETGRCFHSLAEEDAVAKDAGVTSVAISPDGKYLASGSLDRVIRIWEISSGKLVMRLEGHHDSVYSVAFSSDGQSLVSGSLDKTLKVWDLSTSPQKPDRCKITLVGHRDFVLSVAFSPEGNYLMSGSKDRSVQLWDFRTGQPLLVVQGHKNSVISVALSPLGNSFATGSGDSRARIWTLEPLKQQ